MGLFRSRRRKNRGKTTAESATDQTAPAESARREVAAERRPDPDQPGWGRAIGQEIGRARENRPSQH